MGYCPSVCCLYTDFEMKAQAAQVAEPFQIQTFPQVLSIHQIHTQMLNIPKALQELVLRTSSTWSPATLAHKALPDSELMLGL